MEDGTSLRQAHAMPECTARTVHYNKNNAHQTHSETEVKINFKSIVFDKCYKNRSFNYSVNPTLFDLVL